MASDIIMDGDKVIVKATDLILDGPGRRKNNTGERRALVHGFDDKLVINYGKDYPGGVKIEGELAMETLTLKDNQVRLKAADLILDNPSKSINILGTVCVDNINVGKSSENKIKDLLGFDPNPEALVRGTREDLAVNDPTQPQPFSITSAVSQHSLQASYLAITGDIMLIKRSKMQSVVRPINTPVLGANPINTPPQQPLYQYHRVSLIKVIEGLTKSVAELERKVAELSRPRS